MEHADHPPSLLDVKRPILKVLCDAKKAIEDDLLAENGSIKEQFCKDRARWEIYWDELKDKSYTVDSTLQNIRFLGRRHS